MSNPITNTVQSLATYFAIWVAFALIQAGVYYYFLSIDLLPSIIDALVFNGLLSLIGLAIWPLVSYSSLEGAQLFNTLITHIAGAALLIGLSVYGLYNLLDNLFYENSAYLTFLNDSLFWRIAISAVIYVFIALNYYVIIYTQEFKFRKVQESELKQSLKEAELEMLKSQLNPHFIFNSLNSISSLTLTNPEKAQEMVISLSEFLRYSIKPNQENLIPLKIELDAIEQFIAIEKVRFGDRLTVHISCKDDCKALFVPPLIIQPLIENAIKYGVHESLDNAIISIECTCAKDALTISVLNSYDSKSTPPARQSGIGLKNVAHRLSLLYTMPDLLQIDKRENEFIIRLVIPQTT